MLIAKSVFEDYADRIAKQFSTINDGVLALNAAGGTSYYDIITATDVPDVEIPMISAAYNGDLSTQVATVDLIKSGYTNFTNLITALESHFVRDASLTTKTWDGYCTNQSTQVSHFTNLVHYASKSAYMKAVNVWCEDIKLMGTVSYDGVDLTFTPGLSLHSSFSATASADGTKFAGVILDLEITSATASGLVVQITGVDHAGTAGATESVTVTGNLGDKVQTTKKYISITDVEYTSGGANGDSFKINNTKPRTISF